MSSHHSSQRSHRSSNHSLNNNSNNDISFFSRLSQDASNAFQDAYGNFILGDDAGKSARLVLVLKPKLGERIPLGMTFLEINGRAYVRSVQPDSQAARAGVLPRDAIQFASLYHTDFDDEDGDNDDDTHEEGRGNVSSDLDESATSYALACEARGMRISYDELRRLLAEGLDPMQSAFLSPPTESSHSHWTGPPIPSTINICAPDVQDFHHDTTPFRGETPKPVVFVFRRTRQRSGLAGSGLNFRMDDECDFAACLIQKLAPTSDMNVPPPDAWDEFLYDGTDWLLGRDSKETTSPPTTGTKNSTSMTTPMTPTTSRRELESGIPLDDYERQRALKIASLRNRMAAESSKQDEVRGDDVEAATIRGMIQKAVGLAFVRASKVVLGVSLHGGSGIVIARLSDGTWSAPSAIGTWGLGFGIQFGLEVAEYIFILQTQESLDHFRKGSSFNIGGNVGAAVAGIGREAYGAASVGNSCTRPPHQQVKEDEYNDDEDSSPDAKDSSAFGVAPIVAYAKSQGLYVGVSLEGSRIFTRTDVNARAYKFATGREVTAKDILSGKVATPPEAEDMYAALHSVEFTHEMSCLPRPPEILRKDSAHSWHYNRNSLGRSSNSGYMATSPQNPFPFLKELSNEEEDECESFETQFKKFMYGGVSVQRLLPISESGSGKTRKERRTLWLMLPEVGSLRLGFVSKLSDGEGAVSNKSSTQRVKRDTGDSSLLGWEGDLATVASEEITLDSVLLEKDTPSGQIRTGDVQLSNKHSLALTDVTLLSQQSNVPINFSSEDKTEHLRIISIQDVSGTSLLFLANNFREAELLVCGLKLLLERETARLGVRGGLPITALGGKAADGAMSPAAARGFKEITSSSDKSARSSRRGGYASSELGDESTIGSFSTANFNSIPEGRKKWGNVPGRDYMREKAAHTPTRGLQTEEEYGPNSRNGTKYVHGQLIVRDIATNIHLPLPLPLCRVLLLDSTSPVIEKWESNRGDKNFSRTDWTFPPATPRELERHASEHQLIASGSMMGAHRTTSFDRMRNGSLVHLSETQIIDADDSEKLAFTISERMPRRGFSMKVKFVLRSSKDNSCEATVIGEVRPVGKNMSNQAAVHKAFLLVLNELKTRYGSEGKGLMASFLSVVSSLPNPESAVAAVGKNGRKSSRGRGGRSNGASPFRRTGPTRTPSTDSTSSKPRKPRPESGLVSFDDIMNASHDMPPPKEPAPRSRKEERPARPATPSLQQIAESDPNLKKLSKAEKEKKYLENDDFAELPIDEQQDFLKNSQPKTIEVKPLPKIRLSLMPAPREEDEENDSDKSPGAKKKSKKKSSSRRSLGQSSSSRKSSRRLN